MLLAKCIAVYTTRCFSRKLYSCVASLQPAVNIVSVNHFANKENLSFLPFWSPIKIPVASMKYHVGVHLRCPDCRFTRIDNRLAVICKTHPRHKQIQRGKKESRRIHKPYPWRWPDPFDKKYRDSIHHEDRYIKAFEK